MSLLAQLLGFIVIFYCNVFFYCSTYVLFFVIGAIQIRDDDDDDDDDTIHQHNTREKENLHLTSVSKDFGKRSVKYHASKLWNQLPLSLKDIVQLNNLALN